MRIVFVVIALLVSMFSFAQKTKQKNTPKKTSTTTTATPMALKEITTDNATVYQALENMLSFSNTPKISKIDIQNLYIAFYEDQKIDDAEKEITACLYQNKLPFKILCTSLGKFLRYTKPADADAKKQIDFYSNRLNNTDAAELAANDLYLGYANRFFVNYATSKSKPQLNQALYNYLYFIVNSSDKNTWTQLQSELTNISRKINTLGKSENKTARNLIREKLQELKTKNNFNFPEEYIQQF